MEDGGMSRETAGIAPDSIKEDPRPSYRAPGESLTPAVRLRHPPMIRMSCINQHANIRLIMHRGQFPFSFRYQAFTVRMKNRSDFIKLL
jgi:hypothetical protein